MPANTAIYWLRNDLRFHDNETLVRALQGHTRVLLVYPLDLRQFEQLPGQEFRKTGVHRAVFLLRALQDLRRRAHDKGTDIAIIPTSAPATALKKVFDQIEAAAIYTQAEITSEETDDEKKVAAALAQDARTGGKAKLISVWGKSLYHPEELSFALNEAPEPFREFRRAVEKLPIRDVHGEPAGIESPPYYYPPTPTLADLGFTEAGNPAYPGGESAGLERLNYYLAGSHLVQRYRSTRNKSLGADYSSKFSPYLALGCLSPREIYRQITDYHLNHKKSAGNGILFEMRWRDFFLYLGVKHGNRIFRPGGFKDKAHDWTEDHDLFERWTQGRTGLPFVDAHLRELRQTGFMSNRGRVNCASFLTRDYKIDWRWGAAWFESCLIDYEVCANWLNWHTQALDIYYTSAPWQGLKYDKKGEYVKTWLPELKELPAPLVHAPWKMDAEGMLNDLDFDLDRDYYRPGIENTKWDWAWNRLKTGDSSSPRRKKKAAAAVKKKT
ncbi:DASH family cryptochrome [Neolewinella antarctica]|uniref:Cryptochrome DASH n=1 Tax=Neolewinella antarctica TaxID=442734 RepID=A0ABX0XCM4_9BACT|nr:DASH family cryptochrome [Neolewinella antarctica]NJC26683.1 deoxyribodipyrimidine photo-lyase [Neolewinella antarctica]